MDRLASCYFCGDAFDASLSEYPVVPDTLRPADDDRTVVLCGTCRPKLDAVVDEVVAATGSETADDRGERAAVSKRDRNDDQAPLDEGAGTESATTEDQWESPVDDGDGSTDSGADRDPPTERTTDAAVTGRDDATAGDADDGATGTAGDDAGAAEDGDPTLTKLEYNKVMRLLKNRPFPVDRAEIREVATSAYEIGPEEFDAVIEAAVERDLIAVENGQFVDPA